MPNSVSPGLNASNGVDEGDGEFMATISLERQTGQQLGIRLSGADTSEPTAGIFIADIQDGSTTQIDGRLRKFDRILFINGRDVRNAKLSQASALIQVHCVQYNLYPYYIARKDCKLCF